MFDNHGIFWNIKYEYYLYKKDYELCMKYLNKSLNFSGYQVNIIYEKSLIYRRIKKYYHALYNLQKAWNINYNVVVMNNFVQERDRLIVTIVISNFQKYWC